MTPEQLVEKMIKETYIGWMRKENADLKSRVSRAVEIIVKCHKFLEWFIHDSSYDNDEQSFKDASLIRDEIESLSILKDGK